MGAPQYKKDDKYSTDTNNKSRLDNVSRANRTRSARINDDWQYLNEPELSAYPTADETFNASYKDKGIRSKDTVNEEKRRRNVVQISTRRTGEENREVAKRNIRNKAKGLKLLKGASVAKKLKWKAKATAVNISILSWYIWTWLTLQLTFGILGLVMFGAAATIDSTISSNIVLSTIEKGASYTTSAIGSVTDYVGITDSASEGISITESLIAIPLSIFMLTIVIVFTVGIVSLLVAYTQYELANLRPFSGEKAGLKIGSFMLAVLLCFTAFPGLLLWMLVVWKYPR